MTRAAPDVAPEVSIILPCYNGHAFLAQAVASACGQDLEAKEIIVIDDGSTAPQMAAALALLPQGVRVVRQENRGQAAARNRGFQAARARYVLPLDCDDWIEADYARRALELIAGREDAFVYSWVQTFGQYRAVLRKHWDPFVQLLDNRLSYSMLIPRALWQLVGGYDEAMRLGSEDWDFNIRLGLAGAEGLCLPEPLLHYRISAAGMWQSLGRHHYGAAWRGIQRKHPEVYRLPALLRRLRARPDQRRRPAAWLLLAFHAVHRLLPAALSSPLLRMASILRGHLRARTKSPAPAAAHRRGPPPAGRNDGS